MVFVAAAEAEDEDFSHPPSRSRTTSSPTVMTRPHATNRISSFDTDEDGAPSFVSIHHHPDDDPRHGQAADERRQKRLRIAVVVIGALFLTLVTADAFTTRYLEQAVAAFVEWLAGHPAAGVLAVILVYIVATVCFVPGSVLTIGVGYAFGRAFDQHLFLGVLLASTAVFVGASSGSLCCLLLGRYLFRAPVLRLAAKYPVFRAIDRALEGNGFQIMLLLRLSPLIPYNALDYISGVTSISIVHYSLALLGLLPGTVAFCYIGATASSLADGTEASEHAGFRRVVLVLGLFFALAGAALASYYSKVELDKILLQQQREEEEEEMMRDDTNANDAENPTATTAQSQSSPSSLVDQPSRLENVAFGNRYHDVAQKIDQHELT